MPDGGRLPKVMVLIPCVHDTWGFRFQKSSVLQIDFKFFVFSCPISIVDVKMAESLDVTRLSAIKQPYLIRQSHRNCSDQVGSFILVRVGRLELPASCSQSKRATNCATPGYEIFQLWSNMWSTPIFDQLPARVKVLSAQLSQGFLGFPRATARTWAARSQIKRDTTFATPESL